MVSDWQEYRIGDLGKVVTGKTPSTKIAEYFEGPFPFITIPDMGTSPYIRNTARTLSNAGAEVLKSCHLPKGSVMMSCIATIGKCGITIKPSFTNQQINSVICDKEKVNSLYLYYTFTQLGDELSAAGGGGSVYTNVSKARFSNITINLPPLPIQKAISNILGSLDDKIELNRQMNETLVAMTQAIFKSWFVDFDPVIYKALAAGNPIPPELQKKAVRRKAPVNRRKPLPPDISRFFSDSFVDSELGPIPKGWRVDIMSNACKVVDCLHSKKPESNKNGSKLLLQVYNIADSGRINLKDKYLISDDDYKKWISRIEVQESDLIITKTGRVGAVAQIPYGLKAAMGRNLVAIRCLNGKTTPRYLKDLLLSNMMRKEIVSKTNDGTILQSLHVKNIEKLRFAIPSYPTLNGYEKHVDPIHSKIELNDVESMFLSEIRETLLPKLISGEIRVQDTETFIEREV